MTGSTISVRENYSARQFTAASLGPAIEQFIKTSPNNAFLQSQLQRISQPSQLLLFLQRFLVFNDALAARVPYLAGLIHLRPGLFIDRAKGAGFCAQRNARIAAHVAEAASDEYRMSPGRNMVHQHLSQQFFAAALAELGDESVEQFELRNPVPEALETLLAEARSVFFTDPAAENIFAALGFHVGLEFYANEEFNLVDAFLSDKWPKLVAAMKRSNGGSEPYLWLSLHTVVEIGHYRAGMEAVQEAVGLYHDRTAASAMAGRLLEGLAAFADLQLRYYRALFAGLD